MLSTKISSRALYSFDRFFSTGNLDSRIIPHTLPKLPLIDSIVSRSFDDVSFERSMFVGAQHMLETTGTLFEGLISLGAKSDNMYFSGKPYSSNLEVIKAISKLGIHVAKSSLTQGRGDYEKTCITGLSEQWEDVLKNLDKAPNGVENIIILDDGARALETMPRYLLGEYNIVGIEQTRGGLYNIPSKLLPIPLISVATSATKRLVEAPLIITAVSRRINQLLPNFELDKTVVCGVIGVGAIGQIVIKNLLERGVKVFVYDSDETAFDAFNGKQYHNLYRVADAASVITNSRYIFGCTGQDTTKEMSNILDFIHEDTTLISLSSEDKEFKTALNQIKKLSSVSFESPFDNIEVTTELGAKLTFLNGGYPINFDRKPWNVPAREIEITQGLLLGACIQAIAPGKTQLIGDGISINYQRQEMLDPYLQRYATLFWGEDYLDDSRYPEHFFKSFEDIDWIKEHSQGTYYPNTIMENNLGVILAKSLHKTTNRK